MPANVTLILKGLALIAALVVSALVLEETGLLGHIDQGWVDREIVGQGWRGELLFVAVAALAMAAGTPRQVPSFLAGYAFGLEAGVALALAATVVGCIGSFAYARLLGRTVLKLRLGRRMQRVERFLANDTLRTALLVRLLPVGNNLLTNLAAGVAAVPAIPFFVGSALGYLPQTAIFVLLGSGVGVDTGPRIALGVVLFVASALLGLQLVRRYRALTGDGDGEGEGDAGDAPTCSAACTAAPPCK